MKFANLAGQRLEAEPGRSGACPSCGADLVPKCGQQRIWHWAHRGVRTCDTWWEPETEWHREWKNQFPIDWQEIVQFAPDGEKHVADLKTPNGTVIEFQHSFLTEEERASRESFYGNMVWVVDGRRRKRDTEQFFKCVGRQVSSRPPFIVYIAVQQRSALLRDWNASAFPVYFDFGINPTDGSRIFWRRDPISRHGLVYLTPVLIESFVKVHLTGHGGEATLSEGIAVIDDHLKKVSRHTR